jgi:hypothetical protein
VGAAILDFTLDKKGRGKNANGSLALKYSKKLGWQFSATSKKANWRTAWEDGGLRQGLGKNAKIELPVTLTLGTSTFCGSKTLQYKIKEPPLMLQTLRSYVEVLE